MIIISIVRINFTFKMIKDLSFDDDQLIKSDIYDLNDTLIKITKPNALSTASADCVPFHAR